MQIRDLVAPYVAVRNERRPIGRPISSKTAAHLLDCVRDYSAWLNRPAVLEDFNAESVNAFLAAILESGRSPWGVKNRRTGLLILWRFARKQGHLSEGPDRVRGVYLPPLDNDGHDEARMSVLLAFCARLRGTVTRTGLKRSIYWDSLLRCKWRTVLRPSDLLRVKVKDFDPTGWLKSYESKTGKGGWLPLDPSTTQAIAACIALDPDRELIWPGYRVDSFCKAFSKLAKMAGVGGSSRYIRRGAGSEAERRFPGCGWRFMRHSAPHVFEGHYRVRRIIDRDAPGPPPLA